MLQTLAVTVSSRALRLSSNVISPAEGSVKLTANLALTIQELLNADGAVSFEFLLGPPKFLFRIVKDKRRSPSLARDCRDYRTAAGS